MEMRLFAPYNERVELIGSWDEHTVTPMERGDDGTWRADVEIPDGRWAYRFRLPSLSPFMRDEVVEISDPMARLIDNLAGEASVIVVEGGEDVTTAPGFAWEHDDRPLPANGDLILYELHVEEFGGEGETTGTFTGVIDRLDYLTGLGINAVELMPVMAFPGEHSWGYNVRYPFAVEGSYGTPEDFKRLVDACHARGIRVILDIVLNHTETEAPLTRIDFDYWYRQTRDGEPSFGAPLDYGRHDDALDLQPAWVFALDQVEFWVREYHIDGYRLDATAMIANPGLVRAVRDRAREHSGGKPVYVVAENLPEDPSIAGADGPADGAWHQAFEHAVVGWLAGDDGSSPSRVAEVMNPATSGYREPGLVVNYVESHDEHTLMGRLRAARIEGEAAFRRHKLAATLLHTAVGLPMLYQGQEFGSYRERDMDIRPLQWELLDDDYGLYLKEHYAYLGQTRAGSPALKGTDFRVLHVDDADESLVVRRGSGEAEVIVVVNLRDEDRDLRLPFPNGRWTNLLGGRDLDVADRTIADTFHALEARLYVHR